MILNANTPMTLNGSLSQEAMPVTQPSSGSTSQRVPQIKEEPLSQVKHEPVKEMKTESSSSAQEVKVEQEESGKRDTQIEKIDR